jgi:Domain of unknown function (DUF4349)
VSQRDVVAELRAVRVAAPAELRERVRLLTAAVPGDDRRPPRRRWLIALIPVAAAGAAVAAVVLTWPTHTVQRGGIVAGAAEPQTTIKPQAGTPGALSVPASPGRLQRYEASLSLRVANAAAVSDAVKRALRIVASLSGYPVSIDVSTARAFGGSELVLKVPRTHVEQAVTRLSQLGRIVAEQVDVRDLQAGVSATDRAIAQLQRQIAKLRAETQSDAVKRQIAALTARVVALQRTRAATVRAAHYATIRLSVSSSPAVRTKHGHGPLPGLGVAFRWIGIGLVYGLAIGVPALLAVALAWFAIGTVRRRREERLLSRS